MKEALKEATRKVDELQAENNHLRDEKQKWAKEKEERDKKHEDLHAENNRLNDVILELKQKLNDEV